jgi:hypothetical protein
VTVERSAGRRRAVTSGGSPPMQTLPIERHSTIVSERPNPFNLPSTHRRLQKSCPSISSTGLDLISAVSDYLTSLVERPGGAPLCRALRDAHSGKIKTIMIR